MFHVQDINIQYHRRHKIPCTVCQENWIRVLYNMDHKEANKLRFGNLLQEKCGNCESCLEVVTFFQV